MGFAPITDETSYEKMRDRILEEAKKTFRPEFLNRLDDIIVFRSLTKPDLIEILDLEISKVMQRLKAKNISLELDEKAKDFLVEKGYDPAIRRAADAPGRGAVPGRPAGRGNPQGQPPRRRTHPVSLPTATGWCFPNRPKPRELFPVKRSGWNQESIKVVGARFRTRAWRQLTTRCRRGPDRQPHPLPRTFLTHSWWSMYRRTVSRIPCSKRWAGTQPSSFSILEASIA